MKSPTKIGIVGTGNMGRALGTRFAQSGHQVCFGARDKAKAEDAATFARHATVSGSTDDAARFGSVLLWTVREPQPSNVLQDASLLQGKIVIDLNNRDYANEVRTGVWFERALAEQLQQNAPEAHVVKAFNTLAMEAFNIPSNELEAAGAQTFLAGDNDAAKRLVGELASDLGFAAVDLGSGPAAFRAAEALGDVIRLLMIDGKRGGGAHLKLVTLPSSSLDLVGTRNESSYA